MTGEHAAPTSDSDLDPSHLMEVGVGFWPAKTLLSAVELDLFSLLGGASMSGEEVGARLGLHPRAIYDFLDALSRPREGERDAAGGSAVLAPGGSQEEGGS